MLYTGAYEFPRPAQSIRFVFSPFELASAVFYNTERGVSKIGNFFQSVLDFMESRFSGEIITSRKYKILWKS